MVFVFLHRLSNLEGSNVQSMKVLHPDQLGGCTWRAVSFEYNDEGWYMPGYPGVSPVSLWARESSDS